MCRRGTALAKEAGPSQNDRPELEKGPTAHDCGEDQRWVPAGVIARRFHVRFGQAQTWHTLHRMGWMVQVSIRWSAEREDDVGATWIRKPGPGWKDGDGPGRVAVLRGRFGGRMLRPPK